MTLRYRVLFRDEEGDAVTVWARDVEMFEGCLTILDAEQEDDTWPTFYAVPWRDVIVVEGYPK